MMVASVTPVYGRLVAPGAPIVPDFFPALWPLPTVCLFRGELMPLRLVSFGGSWPCGGTVPGRHVLWPRGGDAPMGRWKAPMSSERRAVSTRERHRRDGQGRRLRVAWGGPYPPQALPVSVAVVSRDCQRRTRWAQRARRAGVEEVPTMPA